MMASAITRCPTLLPRRSIHLPFSRVPSQLGKRRFRPAFDYWPDGSLKCKQLADGLWTGKYTYDLAGRLYSISNAQCDPLVPRPTVADNSITSTLYNARGQVTNISYGNGVATSYTYNDARGFLTRIQ